MSSSLFGTNPVSLADLTLDVTSSRLAVAATQRGETDAIVAAVRPFLSLGGVSLEGITPQARISRLTADVRFDGAAVAGLNGQLEMAPGPVASIAFSPDQPLRTLDLSLAGSDDPTGAAFRVNVDRVANSER
ncbi:MAG: hypothetical protein LAO77_25105, partial [Acidobacteriia bacterium]|nr:hypothetical protein [Terriglobia bacterium]